MKQIIQTISLILLLGACTDEKYTDTLLSQGGKPGEPVPVELALNIQSVQSPLSSGTKAGSHVVSSTQVCKGLEISLVETPVTRATYEDEIKNFWVLQFNGTTPGSTLVLKQFINGNTVRDVSLVDLGSGTKSRVIVIANASESTFTSLSIDGTTLTQFNDMGIPDSQTGFPLFNDASNGTNRVLFAGSTDMVVAVNKQADIMLYRTVARVTVNISLSQDMQDKGYTTWSSQFMQIPKKSFYHSISRAAVFPEETVGYTNYNLQPIALPVANASRYLPVNLQHSVPYTTPEKRRVNAAIGATYLQIVGMQMTSGNVIGRSVVYQIHIGSNFTDDYSVSPNYSYTYNITITGESIDDSRVIKFIPGYFSGKLTMYAGDGSPTTNQSKAVTWRYEKRNEVYISDVNPTKDGIKWLSSGSMPSAQNDFMDGRKNTWDLRQNTQYPAIAGCIGLNGATLPNIDAMTWYTPSFGQSLAIYVSGSNTLKTLPNTFYWSSTANATYAWGTQVWTGQSSQQVPASLYNLRCVKDLIPGDAMQ